MTRPDKNIPNGFSLVELSIVLVILGLLTGGILGGQSLIHAAELRSVTEQFTTYQTAVNAFRQRYNALPGDITNATEFWGRADNGSFSGQCADPVNDEGDGTETCNGDGDGIIGTWVGNGPPPYYETFRFWQHLSNAGLLTGKFTGVHGPLAADHTVVGVNGPASKYSGGGWTIEYIRNYNGSFMMFAGEYGNYYVLGKTSTNNSTFNPLLTPEDAWNVDSKLDDGLPGDGTIIAGWWDDCSQADNQNDTEAAYDLGNDDVACSLHFVRAF